MALGCDWSSFDPLDRKRPGVAAVVSGGRILEWQSFGSVVAGGDLLMLDSALYVASLAKQFTAACVGLLILDGDVSTADSVGRWLPELGGTAWHGAHQAPARAYERAPAVA